MVRSVLRSSNWVMMNSICALDSSWLGRYSSKFLTRVFAHSGMSSEVPGLLFPARYSAPDQVAISSDTKILCSLSSRSSWRYDFRWRRKKKTWRGEKERTERGVAVTTRRRFRVAPSRSARRLWDARTYGSNNKLSS